MKKSIIIDDELARTIEEWAIREDRTFSKMAERLLRRVVLDIKAQGGLDEREEK